MTREDAREQLITFIGTFECPSLEAVEMAIEALNREQKKFDAICSELIALKSNLNEPIEVAMAYEKSIAIVSKYARKSEDE